MDRGTAQLNFFPFTLLSLKMRALTAAFVRDDSGQAITEYILFLSISAVAAGALARGIVATLDTITAVFGAQLEQNIKTGRASVDIWIN